MKKLRFCLLLLLAAAGPGVAPALLAQNAAAQDLRIQVSSDGVRVGYAYVFIGDTFHAMADSTGTTYIPALKLKRGDVLSARFVGMESVPFVYDGNATTGTAISLELTPNSIDKVVVTARDLSKRSFRRYIKKLPKHGWFVGFRGDYDMRFHGDQAWQARGRYERNHIPGEYVRYIKTDTFTLQPALGSTGFEWQVKRYLLHIKGIAERAVLFGDWYDGNKGMIVKYRGQDDDGRHLFLLVRPYFDGLNNIDDSFQTLIRVDGNNGRVLSSETISQTKYGIWNVSATYAVHYGVLAVPDDPANPGMKSGEFIYPTRVVGKYEEIDTTSGNNTLGDVVIDNIAVYGIPFDATLLNDKNK